MTALQLLLALAVSTSPDSTRGPVPQEGIARVAYAAVQALPGVVLLAPWDSLGAPAQNEWVSAVSGVRYQVEPAPCTREERLFRLIVEGLLKEGVE